MRSQNISVEPSLVASYRSEAQPGRPAGTISHRPQLDSLRAFAVLAVVLHHYDVRLLRGSGNFRCQSVFCTERLSHNDDPAKEPRGGGKYRTAFAFCFGQLLRPPIPANFPLYYFLIFLGLALHVSSALDNLPWLVTYTLNFHMAHQG